jgi:ubiquinone/menaquinone biosynthesis C-methylase UbiE
LDTQNSDSERWENGCQEDDTRNGFVIPEIVKVLSIHRPTTILDVGAATGYLSRNIDAKLNFRPFWTCLDQSKHRLDFAQLNKVPFMNVEFVLGDFLTKTLSIKQFESVIFSFTLLEIGLSASILKRIDQVCARGGTLIIVLPDAWRDVLSETQENLALAHRFLTDEISIQKIDKFTGTQYPFKASRLESVIMCILSLGFVLEILTSQEAASGTVFLLAFKRR